MMNSFKSMWFGDKPKAVKWLGMNESDDDDEKDSQMFVREEALNQVLMPLGDQRINLISIFGAARQGKSFLMNLLADQQDLFKISNLREPCTQGVDLSAHFVPLQKFSAMNGCPQIVTRQDNKIQIGFVDAEGQGDRDITYDSRLVSPVLLASKVVIFNWKDSLQSDRILNLLAVLARAAQGIELQDGDSMKVFGHLHIIFRDWSFVDSTPEEVFRDLFQNEKGRSEEVNVRNLARVNLIDAFESISIWLFPPPVSDTANLRDKIRFDQLNSGFQQKLRELRKSLSNQLQKPMLFNRKPLTARMLAKLMPALVETLNSDQVIMPESIYSSMVRAEAKSIREECEKSIQAYCEAAGAEKDVVSTEEMDTILCKDIELLIADTMESMKGVPKAVQNEMETALQEYAKREIRLALHMNDEHVLQYLAKQVQQIFADIHTQCSRLEQGSIPMERAELEKKCESILLRMLERLESLPRCSNGQQTVDAEAARIRQHASLLFDRLHVENDKAIHKAHGMFQETVQELKSQLSTNIHAILDRTFAVRRPATVAVLQSELDGQFRKNIQTLRNKAGTNSLLSTESFEKEMLTHKNHLAEEMNRRYLMEIRQILNEVGYEAKEKLVKEISSRLQGKLDQFDEEGVQEQIDEAVQVIKVQLAEQLQGWTVLKSDISTKSAELEKVGDKFEAEYLEKKKSMREDALAKQREAEYLAHKQQMLQSFQEQIKVLDLPVTKQVIEETWRKMMDMTICTLVPEKETNHQADRQRWKARLEEDSRTVFENAKALNDVAREKKEAMELAERERQLRDKEVAEARRKENEINELKVLVANSIDKKEEEARQLREQLQREAQNSRLLQQQIEEMKKLQEAMRLEKLDLEMKAQEEALRREEAENAAREAAEMAAKSASAAIAAAALEVTPLKIKNELKDYGLRKRGEDGKENTPVAASPDTKRHIPTRTPEKRSATPLKGSDRKRRRAKGTPTPNKNHSKVEEARRAAREAIEKRTQERLKSLSVSAKKKRVSDQ